MFALGFSMIAGIVVTHAAPASQLDRYPYLTDDSSSHATIELASSVQTPPVVLTYGLSPNCTGASVSASGTPITVNSVKEYQFTLQLTGLAPGQTYCYGVAQGTTNLLGSDPKPSFKSALAAADPTAFSFAVIGDWGANPNGFNNPQEAALMSLIHNSGVSFAVSTGDNTYNDGSQTNYGDLHQQGANLSNVFANQYWGQSGASIPMFAGIGDHGFSTASTHFLTWNATMSAADSKGSDGLELYSGKDGTSPANYPSEWYAFSWGEARFYVLTATWGYSNLGTGSQYKNDYDYHWAAGDEEVTWLKNDLQTAGASAPAKFAFVYFPFHSDNPSQPTDTYLDGTNNLEGLLANNKVTVAFDGHAHIYERNKPQIGSMATYTSGGGGGLLEPVNSCSSFDGYAIGWSPTKLVGYSCNAPTPTSQNQVNEYIKVTVNGSQVTVAPINANGTQFDVQNYTVSAPVTAGPATHFSVATSAGSVAAGSPVSVTITALDSNARTASSYSGGKSMSFTGLSNAPHGQVPTVPANPVSFNSGVATVSLTPYDAQSTTLTVKDSNNTSISGSKSLTVTPLSATSFDLSALGSQTAGTAFSETAKAVDPYGNVNPNYSPSGTSGTSGAAFVQEVGGIETATASSLRTSLTSTAGDLLVACIGMYSGGTLSTTSVTDSAGNTWHPMPTGNPMFVASHNSRGELWYSLTSSSVTWVQANFSGAVSAATSVLEFSGVAAVNKSAGASNTGTAASSGATAALSSAGELAVGFAAIHGSTSAITSTAAGYTATTQRNSSVTSSLVGVRAAYKLSAGTAAETFTATTPSVYWADGVVTFTAKSGGGGGSSGGTAAWSGLDPSPTTSPGYPSTTTFTSGVAQVSITPYDAQSTTLRLTAGSVIGSTPITVGMASRIFKLATPVTPSAGVPFTVSVTVQDRYGNVDAQYTGSHSLQWSGPATDSPNHSYTPTFPASVSFTSGNGQATMTLVRAQPAIVLTATESGITGSSGSFNVGPGSLSSFTVSMSVSSPTAGTPFTVTATALDRYGDILTGYSGSPSLDLTAAHTAPDGVHAPTVNTPMSMSGGTGSGTVTLFKAEPVSGVTVRDGTSSGSTGQFIVVPARPSLASVQTSSSQMTAGSTITATLSATDAYGNAATNYNGTRSLQWTPVHASPNGTQPSFSSATFSSGAASAFITLYDAETITLNVTDNTVIGQAAPVTVNPGPADHFTLSQPGDHTAGSTFQETVSAVDQYGNVQTAYGSGVQLSWSAPTAPDGSKPVFTDLGFSGGVDTTGVQLFAAQPTVLTVNDGGAMFGSTVQFNVAHAPMAGFYLVDPGTQNAGGTFTEPVSAVDQYRNVVGEYNGTIQWGGPSSIGTFAPQYSSSSITNGLGSADVTLYAAESPSLNVSAGGLSGTSGIFTVNPGPTASLQLSVASSAVTSGTSDSGNATALDAYGNVATDSSTLNVTYQPGDTACTDATCQPTVTLTAGEGSFSFIFVTPGQEVLTVSGEGFTSNSQTVDVSL